MKWPAKWIHFKDVVKDCTGGQHKVKKRDYLPKGQTPVIDQGQSLIAGYTNEDTAAFSGDLPVVLFGDHTLILKYVDFPFALGADGVKALSVCKPLLPKYLFYYWQSCKLQSRGYSRHFKYLREIKLPFIPLSEQRRIVQILDQADALRKKRAEADAKAARILPALFHRMFGNWMTNDKGWPTRRLNDVGQIVTGCTPSTKQEEYYEQGIRPWARPADCDGVILVRETEKRLSESGWDVARVVPESSVLVVCIGATLGKVALAGCDLAINQQINAVVPSKGIAPEFLYIQCVLLAERFRAHATKSTLPILNKSRFGAERIICPPSDLQEQFTRAAHRVIRNHDIRNELGSRCNRLFNTLLHRAFTGDLTADWREAHMKELLVEMESQARALEKHP